MAKSLQTKYELVSDPEWKQITASLRIAVESKRVAEKRYAKASDEAKAILEQTKKSAVQCDDYKFSLKTQAGRKTFDKEALKKDYPTIDLEKYNKVGFGSTVFRVYGPKDTDRGDLDNQLLTLHDELVAFVNGESDVEGSLSQFEKLRNEAELYIRALDNESSQLNKALKTAHAALVKRVQEMDLADTKTVSGD